MFPGVTPAHKRLALSGLSSKKNLEELIYIYHSRHTQEIKLIPFVTSGGTIFIPNVVGNTSTSIG
jgi:hypothetical protein